MGLKQRERLIWQVNPLDFLSKVSLVSLVPYSLFIQELDLQE